MAATPPRRPIPERAWAALICLGLGVFWGLTLEVPVTWGWDEVMHVELPAARMVLAVGEGESASFWSALHECSQYPFGWPLALAALQGLFGISETLCRLSGIAAWALALFGLFLLGEELARAQRAHDQERLRGDRLLPWLALAFGALSPLSLAYAGTLFLEVPFTCCAVFALRAWLRRGPRLGERGIVRRELCAGAWLVAAFFFKFNYGLLLAFGCALDWLCELFIEHRAGRLRPFLRRGAFLSTPPVLGLIWWFALPLPLGLETAALHREAFLGFLGGNLELVSTPGKQRVLYWAVFFAATARLFAVEFVALGSSLREIRRPGARFLWLVFLGGGVPVWFHPFHLDRFLIPGGPAFWALAALGLARLSPAAPPARAVLLGALALGALLLPGRDAPFLAGRLGLLADEGPVLEMQGEILDRWHRLGTGRSLPTPGLEREVAEELFALVTAEAGPDERVGWLGVSTELSPAAIHLALLAAGGSPRRFLRDAHRPMDVSFTDQDPGWSDEELLSFAERFDLFFTTDPPDARDRGGRAFVRGYAQRLVAAGWEATGLGEVLVPRAMEEKLPLRLYVLRPPG